MLNQPRYSDDGGGSSRTNSGNSRRSVHSTGRSNYGGGGGGGGIRGRRGPGNANDPNNNGNNNTNGQGNPIANWIQSGRRRLRSHNQQRPGGAPPVAVGTEANAIRQMTRNAKHFAYPPEGFVTPIEHSLLYAMIQYPERYPESVVRGEIDDEEFEQYLYAKDDERTTMAFASGGRRRRRRERRERERDDGDQIGSGGNNCEEGGGSDNVDDDEDEDERRVSYAQLSALLALSAEKNPSTAAPDNDGRQQRRPSSSSSGGGGSGGNVNININNNGKDESPSVGQALCRKLLRTVTRYCDANSLDRSTEIAEFLNPVERRCQSRNERAAMRTLLPAYAGYTVSLLTGNPLPLLIGVAALSVEDTMVEETANVTGFSVAGGRRAQIETAGLLDECDSD